MAKSIEEKIEDLAKAQLKDFGLKYFTKTESINSAIDNALEKAPSKSGGSGKNFPDIKCLINNTPVMIEVKGKNGDLIKLNPNGEIDNTTKEGKPNFLNIKKYAVNGAVHYAHAILKYSDYKEVIAIGVNGYEEAARLKTEFGVYYVSKDNFGIPKEIGKYTDLSFLAKSNRDDLLEKIKNIDLTPDEIEAKSREYENLIEISLKKLNQKMQDDLQISVGSRVELITGMIMAGLGVQDKVKALASSDLKSSVEKNNHDGHIIINKIDSFLEERDLPRDKKDMIINDLSRVFIYSELWKPINGESKLKSVYIVVEKDILPLFTSARHLDFTGKLFNVLNEWVDIPDSDKNDVVLTPRYVTDLMAKLAQVNMNSYVWDYAAGSAGFLISSMKLMLKDAQEKLKSSPKELQIKNAKIKYEQLLGIEKRADIYLLAVLNMILMGDGSSNIIHKDSLKDFEGQYEQGKLKGETYPADVFLLNPPYSADGKGFVFVEKALGKMSKGKAAVLIQENAGSGSGLPYTKNILQRNTLLASIHMSDIFCGKAGVQTAIYVFDVGTAHDVNKLVKFIDFSNDGYTRQNRKKSGQDVNLKNTDHADERYKEIVDIVLNRKKSTHYFDDYTIEDTITLNGNDWTYNQHKKIDTVPTEQDFKKTVADYLSWKVSTLLKEENSENF